MNSKSLQYPHRWEERKPQLDDDVLFVPNHYLSHDEFSMPAWEDIFGNTHPVSIEFCSGNGEWVVNKAKMNPAVNWVAVEWDFGRVKKIHARKRTLGVDNLLIVAGEALTFARHYVKASTVDEIYVNFPDPWPKARHAKHRLVQEPFALECARLLKEEGSVIMATDHELYAQQMIEVFSKAPGFSPAFAAPYFISQWEGYGTSYFESLWKKKGLNIHYIQYKYHGNRTITSI